MDRGGLNPLTLLHLSSQALEPPASSAATRRNITPPNLDFAPAGVCWFARPRLCLLCLLACLHVCLHVCLLAEGNTGDLERSSQTVNPRTELLKPHACPSCAKKWAHPQGPPGWTSPALRNCFSGERHQRDLPLCSRSLQG